MTISVEHPPVATAATLMTTEDLEVLSSGDLCRYELIRGVLSTMSPAGSEHGILIVRLTARMQLYVEENAAGYVFAAETGFLLEQNPDTVRAPDIAFVSHERMPADGPPRSYFPGAPDLAVEVMSPNDTVGQVQEKVQMWLRFGTQLVWIVEPGTQTVTVFRRDGSGRLLQSDDVLDGESLLPGFQYPVARLFAY